jgi:hypothetical protein
LPRDRDEHRLLYAMGWETANVHLGTKDLAAAVKRDLKKRPSGWLRDATKTMIRTIEQDWKIWCR